MQPEEAGQTRNVLFVIAAACAHMVDSGWLACPLVQLSAFVLLRWYVASLCLKEVSKMS